MTLEHCYDVLSNSGVLRPRAKLNEKTQCRRMENVSKLWDSTAPVDGVSFETDPGSFLVLLGATGCGKSSTPLLIAGLEWVWSGRHYHGREDVTDSCTRQTSGSRHGISIHTRCSPHLDGVRKSFFLGITVRKTPASERSRQLDHAPASLLGLGALLGREPSQLSEVNSSALRSAAPSSPRRRFA